MLLEFRVSNFRSIKDQQILSLLPSGRIKQGELPFNLISDEHKDMQSALKSTIIYGGNASGKSNLLRALHALRYLVLKSIDYKLDDKIEPYEPYKLDKSSLDNPIEMEIDFIAKDNIRYIYKIVFDNKKFLHESLYFFPMRQRAKLFVREGETGISYGDYFTKDKKNHLLPNQLLLSRAGSSPIEPLNYAYRFFSKDLISKIAHDTHYDNILINTFSKIIAEKKDTSLLNNMLKLICIADTGICDIATFETQADQFAIPAEISDEEKQKLIEKYKYIIKTKHKVFDKESQIGEISFDLRDESTGTIKLLAIGSLILETLQQGGVIVIDELDKSLHPLLTRLLIKLFNSEKNNPKNAQLIFATHDVSLIDITLFRRDQIWLVEKNSKGATEIYSLSEYTGISKIKPLMNWYIRGRFGAIPQINESELNLDISS